MEEAQRFTMVVVVSNDVLPRAERERRDAAARRRDGENFVISTSDGVIGRKPVWITDRFSKHRFNVLGLSQILYEVTDD